MAVSPMVCPVISLGRIASINAGSAGTSTRRSRTSISSLSARERRSAIPNIRREIRHDVTYVLYVGRTPGGDVCESSDEFSLDGRIQHFLLKGVPRIRVRCPAGGG